MCITVNVPIRLTNTCVRWNAVLVSIPFCQECGRASQNPGLRGEKKDELVAGLQEQQNDVEVFCIPLW